MTRSLNNTQRADFKGFPGEVSGQRQGELDYTKTMSTNLQLSWDSGTIQSFNPSTEGLYVILPSFNNLPLDGPFPIMLLNRGKCPVGVKTFEGYIVSWVMPGRTITVFVDAPRTADAKWAFETGSEAEDNSIFVKGFPQFTGDSAWTYDSSSDTYYGSGVWLSDSILITALGYGTTLKFKAAKIEAGVPKWGVDNVSTATPTNTTTATGVILKRKSNTHFVFAFVGKSGGDTRIAMNSGSVNTDTLAISFGGSTYFESNNNSPEDFDYDVLDSSTGTSIGLWTFNNTASALVAYVVTMGTAVATAGSCTVATGEDAENPLLLPMSSTLSHVVWSKNSATKALKAARITVATSTTPTAASVITLVTSDETRPKAMWKVSDTQSICFNMNSAQVLSYCVLTDTGTAITAGTNTALLTGFPADWKTRYCRGQYFPISTSRFAILASHNADAGAGVHGGYMFVFKWDGSTVVLERMFHPLGGGDSLGNGMLYTNWKLDKYNGKIMWMFTSQPNAGHLGYARPYMMFVPEI